MSQCTAKSKRSGERCKNFCSPGRTVCRFHGGRTPRGFNLPQTRHGFYSRNLPPHLRTTYQKSLTDPRRVELREFIALVDARLAQLLQEYNLIDEENRMDKARIQFQRMKNAWTNGDRANLRSAMIELDRLIRFGVRDYQIWKEIVKMLERRSKLSMSQLKWEIDSGQMIPADQAITLFTAVGHVIKDNITDPKILEEISEGIYGLIDQDQEKAWAETHTIKYGEIIVESIRRPR